MDLGDVSPIAGVALAAAAGVVSFLSPCVAPLVPGYVAFVAGAEAHDARPLRRAIAFVAGFTAIFTLLGLTAASLSRSLLENRDIAELGAGLVVALLGLVMLRGGGLPGLAGRISPRLRAPTTALGAVLVGAAFAVAWSPCIGPVLGAILGIAAGQGDPAYGALLLVCYSLGLGLPFVLVGIGVGRARSWSAILRRHTRSIQVTAGLLMIAMGALIAAGVLGRLTAYLARIVQMPL